MKIDYDEVHEEKNRGILWTKIKFSTDSNDKKSVVIAAASREYLDDFYKIKNHDSIEKKHLDDWIQKIAKKWEALGDSLYNQKTHYDPYANTNEGEANIIDFLLKQTRAKN